MRVDSVFTIQQGKQVSKKNRIGDNQRSFLRTKNVFWGSLDLNDLDQMHFSDKDEERLALQKGDLLLCEGGDVGRTVICRNELPCCYFQNHLHRLRAVDGEIDPEFSLYWFWYAFKLGNVYFGRKNVTTIPNMSKSRLGELPMPKPDLSEQRQIAKLLSAVQRAIEQQERLIALTTELKRALMHKLFTEGTRGEEQKQTEIGPVPKSWEVVVMHSIVDFKTGKLDSNAAVEGGTYPFYTCAQKTFRINKYAFDQEAILLSGNNAKAIYSVKHYKGQFNAYQRTYVITILDEKEYGYLFLKYALTRQLEYLRTISIGSQTRYLTLGMLNTLKLPKPDLTTQQFIGNTIDTIDNKIANNESQKQLLNDLFRTLLHQLMTAQIRVNDVDLHELEIMDISESSS